MIFYFLWLKMWWVNGNHTVRSYHKEGANNSNKKSHKRCREQNQLRECVKIAPTSSTIFQDPIFFVYILIKAIRIHIVKIKII